MNLLNEMHTLEHTTLTVPEHGGSSYKMYPFLQKLKTCSSFKNGITNLSSTGHILHYSGALLFSYTLCSEHM